MNCKIFELIKKFVILQSMTVNEMLNSFSLEDIKPVLINLTGVRLLVIFSLLVESPKTAEEINDFFVKNNYPNELFSSDTLRNDMNALRLAGCEISRADKHNGYKYKLISHPFELKIDMHLAKGIAKIYDRIYKDLDIRDLVLIDGLLTEFAKYTDNDVTSEFLKGISLIKNIKKDVLQDLIKAQQIQGKISFDYKSPTGKSKIDFVVENFEVRNRKLYVDGYSITHENNSFLLISKICSPITFFLKNEEIDEFTYKVIYELKNVAKINFEEKDDERVIKSAKDRITVEFLTDNKFKLIQKILSYGSNCVVISPETIRQEVIEKLKDMREVYKNG